MMLLEDDDDDDDAATPVIKHPRRDVDGERRAVVAKSDEIDDVIFIVGTSTFCCF
jgi:hypothetical protein